MLIIMSIRDPGGYKGLGVLMFIGLVQIPYMVPAILIARSGHRMALAKGLTIGAAITFLLNATCWMIAVN